MKIALIGYGKMGREIERVALSRGHQIVARIDVDNQEEFHSEAFKSADVAIEFTIPKVAMSNYLRCFAANVKVVSGTTGWLEQLPQIEKACNQEGQTFFYASNFSLGVNIFFELNKQLARLINGFDNYAPQLKEIHHVHKLDAPSGTAITLAEGIIENSDIVRQWELGTTARPGVIPIEALREGEVPGYHEVRYESVEDSITIVHNAKSRAGFALGAVVAAEFTAEHTGFLTMQNLLRLQA